MSIHFVNITKDQLLNEYKRVYHHTTIDRFSGMLNLKKLIFVNPASWNDPFEKFFYEREFSLMGKKIQLPIRNNLYSLCVTGTGSSEAFWKVYSPMENGIRLTFDMNKFIKEFLGKIKNAEIHIGKVNYKSTKEFHKLMENTQNLITELNDSKIGPTQINLMIQKRKAFEYEDELRIMIIPNRRNKSLNYKINADIKNFTIDYLLDPRVGKNHAKLLKHYFKAQFQIKLSQATLYNEIKRGPINLDQ